MVTQKSGHGSRGEVASTLGLHTSISAAAQLCSRRKYLIYTWRGSRRRRMWGMRGRMRHSKGEQPGIPYPM